MSIMKNKRKQFCITNCEFLKKIATRTFELLLAHFFSIFLNISEYSSGLNFCKRQKISIS